MMKWNIYFAILVGILLAQVVSAGKMRQQTDGRSPQIHSNVRQTTVVENARDSLVNIGGNITAYTSLVLFCNVTGYPRPVIRWKIKAANFTKKLMNHGNKLVVTHNPHNSGYYICKAKNSAGSAKKSSFIKFLAAVEPTIPESRQKIFAINGENRVYLKIGADLTTIAGTEIDIHCMPSGIPKPQIKWYHNGKLCQESHLIQLEDPNYFYNKAIPSNATGNYTCVARNVLGVTNVTSQVEVIEPVYPTINGSDRNEFYFDMTRPLTKLIGGRIETLVGVSIWLECPVSGFPAPEIAWEKDNIPITTGKRVRIKEGRLNLLGTIKSDTGWYTCVAFNGAGSVSKATFIQLLAPIKPRIKEARYRYSYIVDNLPTPLKTNVGVDLRILAHRKVTIFCTASGFPRPVITWFKNSKPLTKEDAVDVSSSGQRLIFNYLRITQSALYTCVASNAAGRDIARTRIIARLPRRPILDIRMTVLTEYNPFVLGKMKAYALTSPRLVRGSDVLLECVAVQGYPSSTFKWFKDDKPLYISTKELFNKSRFKIRNLSTSDQGTYKCFGNNNVGQHQTTIQVYFEDASSH